MAEMATMAAHQMPSTTAPLEGASVVHSAGASAGASASASFSVMEFAHTQSLEAFLASLPALSATTTTTASKSHVSCVESQGTSASLLTHANCGRFNSGLVAATGDHAAADAFFATLPSINNNNNNSATTPFPSSYLTTTSAAASSASGWVTGPADVSALPVVGPVMDFNTLAASTNAGEFFASLFAGAGVGAGAGAVGAGATNSSDLPRSLSFSLSEFFHGEGQTAVVPDALLPDALFTDLPNIIVVDVLNENADMTFTVGGEVVAEEEEEEDYDDDDDGDEDDEYESVDAPTSNNNNGNNNNNNNNNNNKSKKRKRAPKVAVAEEVKQTDKYKERRRKNNAAAARNREMKRQQAKQEQDRLPALTTRNVELKEQCASLKEQLALLKARLASRLSAFGL